MSQINCLRCKQPIDVNLEQCPACGERVTMFQRTYSSKLLDGKYQILDRLGVGGMGEIFKVRHIHLNELRVIKIMRPNVAADDQGMQRFLQEARTSTMIKHKNLAMLYDFAQLDDGSYYMVWEFIDGTNIQKWIAQNGAMPSRLAIEISIQALSGLDHLHSMGLIHRDISPENIMLSQDHHGKLLVKVIDFGIAKQLAEGEGGQGLTQTGMFLGKLKYASPEQAGFLKEGEHLDPRSDLYSFGIVMYEMLAGRAPFQATNPHGYILKHVTEKPLPIHELNPAVKVPSQVESVIMRSLEKSRDNRYATAADFEHALEAIRNTVPPDAKYGLGERMITLSGAQTLAELPKFMTGPGGTYSGQQATQQTMTGQPTQAEVRVGPTGTRVGSDEATVMERNLGAASLAGAPGTRTGSDEATVMERFNSQAAPTAAEQKWSGGPGAEATMIERQITPGSLAPKKSNSGMMIGIAAAVVIVLGVAGFLIWKNSQSAAPTVAASTTSVTATAPTSTAPIAAGQGALLLSASPSGELETIIDDKGKSIDLTDERRDMPTRIDLEPGRYKVTVAGPNGTKQTVTVDIEAGKRNRKMIKTEDVNFEELEKEVAKP
ncbi:MAG: eukaryotic-like serine/threonine-protein kinase [Thermoanaerobaculia bacterium]|jgi:serine/threonine-protein kinase|nr:eukaryotic-like serine/threonine-protein kinase [Thermoanaerobaculia bacterium]